MEDKIKYLDSYVFDYRLICYIHKTKKICMSTLFIDSFNLSEIKKILRRSRSKYLYNHKNWSVYMVDIKPSVGLLKDVVNDLEKRHKRK